MKNALPLLLVALMATPGCGTAESNTVAAPQSARRSPETTGGFLIGAQAWSFRKFTLFESIAKNAAAGGTVIELFPGQKIAEDTGDAVFDRNISPALLEKIRAELARHRIRATAIGVIDPGHTEAAWRKTFDVAKSLGVLVINTENVGDLDLLEKLAKEYDIKVGIHNHPARPGYRLWNPEYVLGLIKGRDPHIGACADTGHWVRSGLRPVDCLRILKGRIVSSHLKDLNAFAAGAHDVRYGSGVCDIRGILEEFKSQGFTGPISVEYEYAWENNGPDIKACIDYVRAAGLN